MAQLKSEVNWQGREFLEISLEVTDEGQISSAQTRAIGNYSFLNLVNEYRSHLKGLVKDLPLTTASTPGALALRECVLKLKGAWQLPLEGQELCHCRGILAQTVDRAICMGAHNIRQIREATSANTACGTCIGDVESLLNFRLHQKKPSK